MRYPFATGLAVKLFPTSLQSLSREFDVGRTVADQLPCLHAMKVETFDELLRKGRFPRCDRPGQNDNQPSHNSGPPSEQSIVPLDRLPFLRLVVNDYRNAGLNQCVPDDF